LPVADIICQVSARQKQRAARFAQRLRPRSGYSHGNAQMAGLLRAVAVLSSVVLFQLVEVITVRAKKKIALILSSL